MSSRRNGKFLACLRVSNETRVACLRVSNETGVAQERKKVGTSPVVFTREPPLGSKRDVQDTVRAALLAGKHVGTLCADRLLLCFEKLPAVTAAVVEDSRAHPATRSGRSRGGVRETVDQDRNRAPHRKAKEPEKRSGRAVRDSRETVGRPTLDD